MKKTIIYILFSLTINFSQTVKIDHLPIIVTNIDSAITEFQQVGFFIKPGRIHSNGLKNAHIKFSDLSSMELVEVSDKNDIISTSYKKFLNAGEGGTFLALKMEDPEGIKTIFKNSEIKFSEIKTKGFHYITFNDESLNHIFLIKYLQKIESDKKYFNHINKAKFIKKIKLSGNAKTKQLLELLFNTKGFEDEELWKINCGTCEIIIQKSKESPFRVKEVSLSRIFKDINIRGIKINQDDYVK